MKTFSQVVLSRIVASNKVDSRFYVNQLYFSLETKTFKSS